jgi:large subunit ribosomal protein L23
MATKAKEKKLEAAEWMYEIISSPHVTEKAGLALKNHNQVTFHVPGWATKPQIKDAVETIFGAKVKGVNTLIQKGKTKRFKGFKGFRSDAKKAMVTFEEGQALDFVTWI